MTSCVFCASSLDATRKETHFTTRDEAGSHAGQHLSQMKHFDDKDSSSLDQVFEQCFPNFVETPARKQKKIVVKKEGRQSLLNVCQKVFKGRISKASPRVICQKCLSEILLYGGKQRGLRFGLAINHASTHLGISLFECRKCGRSFFNKNALCIHLHVTHSLRCLSEYFKDNSGDFIEEITISFEQCFADGYNDGPSDEKAPILRLKNEANVRSHTKGSKLAIERQLQCYHLIRQLAGDDGKIQCRICPKRIYAKHQERGFEGKCAMVHALVHLKKPLFRCKLCSIARHTRDTIALHLKSAHALPLSNNYDCLVDEFHADVMDTLRKCYAEELGK